MLKEIDRHWGRLNVGGREYRVVINLNSMLYLEDCGLPYDHICDELAAGELKAETVLRIVHAAMCSLPWNRKAVSARRWDAVRPTLAQLGEMIYPKDLPGLRSEIVALIAQAMPDPDSIDESKGGGSSDAGTLRAVFCDIMGRPDAEFWGGTYREIFGRIDSYLEAKGMKEEAVQIQYMDKED